jgi:8-oxo-dGTP pyrophosphatase MutT (NUDIX family)
MNKKFIQAAGGIVYRSTHKNFLKPEILLVHRSKYDDWSLPKGKLLAGETWEDAAVREVQEETGYLVKIESFSGPVFYNAGRIPKVVLFWNMRVLKSARFKATTEVDQIRWMTIRKALTCLSYVQEKDLVRKFYVNL